MVKTIFSQVVVDPDIVDVVYEDLRLLVINLKEPAVGTQGSLNDVIYICEEPNRIFTN